MSDKQINYINSCDYTKVLGKKTRRAAVIISCILVIISLITVYLAKYTDIFYQTDLFRVPAERSFPINCSSERYDGKYGTVAVESLTFEDDMAYARVRVTDYGQLSESDFSLVKFTISGLETSTALCPVNYSVSQDELGITADISFLNNFGQTSSDTTYCIKVNSNTDDGIIYVLCDIDN